MSVSTILTSTRGFVRSSAFLASALAFAAALPMASIAATPVAVWDGDFTAAQTGFTLNRSGNAISQDNSTITIDQDVGVKVDFDSAMPNGMTVLFRYTNLSLDSDKTMASSFAQGSNENSTGVQLVSTSVNEETVGVPSGFYNTSTTHNTGATQNNVTSSMLSGVMAFSYTNGGGTKLYYITNNTASVVYSCPSLKSGTDFTGSKLKGCAIGGERAKSGATLFPAATGMKITGIAIFDSGLTEAEMANYDFPSEIQEYTLSLDGTSTYWSAGEWKIGTESVAAPLSGYATINLSASTTLTMDEAVSLKELTVQGEGGAVLTLVTGTGSLVANVSVTVKSGVLKQGSASVLGATPKLYVKDGATFDMNGLSISGSTAVYIAGAGAGNWPWALTSSSGAGGAILGGLYLSANATIGGANELKVGQTQSGYYCYLQGFTLTKTGAGAFTGTNMNTPGTGTIDVQGGAMSVNQWNNLNNGGGNTTVILHTGASLANGTDRVVPMGTLKLLGGTLTTTRAFKANTLFVGAGETANLAFGAGASASLTGDLTVTGALTLDGAMAFNKDENAANDVVVTVSGTMSSSGAISVGAGVTLNIGTSRPTGEITVAEGGKLAARLQGASDVIELSVSAQPDNVVLYDVNGDVVSNPRISYADGTLTIMPPVPTLEASGEVAFDTASNWINSTMPDVNGDAIIELSDDATISVSGSYTLSSLTITGAGEATFAGEGSITADNISVKNGATFVRNAKISATTGISLDSGTVLKLNGVTESAAISGAGAVETYGTVVLNHANTMTGGITVKPGSLLSASAAGAYGEYQDSWAYTQQRQVIVENGGTVDINNIANNDGGVALTIAGKGVVGANGVYAGAVKYSGANAITSGSRQISSLVLTGDAMVDVGAGWGLVHSGWKNARLGLNGYTLTVRGTGTFPVVNANNLSGTATTGTLVMDGATLELSNAASNLTGVNIVAKGCSSINIATAPSALGSLAIRPSATGMTASGWNLPSTPVPSLDTSNVDPTGLTGGQVLTLFTAPSALSEDTISVNAGGRFTTAIDGNTVTATVAVGMPANFIHYDFNAANSRAADSTYSCGNMNPSFVASKNGRAGVFDSNTKPYYGSNTSGKSPFHAGEMTVTSLLKVREANNTILWNFGSGLGGNAGIALIAKNSTTVSLVQWTNGAANGSDVVSVTDVDLMDKWHLVTIVANASGTTLYVDDRFATVDTVLPSGISGQGQFGSIHSAKGKYEWLLADGYLLDDWRVYDAALTRAEVKAIKREISPDPIFIRLR